MSVGGGRRQPICGVDGTVDPVVPPLSPGLEAAAARLRAAAEWAAFERMRPVYDAELERLSAIDLDAAMASRYSVAAREAGLLDHLVETYEAQTGEDARDRFDADLQALHRFTLQATVEAARALQLHRAHFLARLVEAYRTPAQRESLALCTAALLATRANVPFRWVRDPSAEGGRPTWALDDDDRIGLGTAGWLGWSRADLSTLRPQQRAELDAMVEVGLTRRVLLQAHPLLLIAVQAFPDPLQFARLLYGEPGGPRRSLDEAGGLIRDALIRKLAEAQATLAIDPNRIDEDPDVYAMAHGLYLQAGAEAFARWGRHGTREQDPIIEAIRLAQWALGPRPWYEPVERVLFAAGIAVMLAGLALGPAFLAGAIVLELTLGSIGVGLRAADLRRAIELSAVEDADALFETIEPGLDTYEGSPGEWIALGSLMVELLFFAMPVAEARRLTRFEHIPTPRSASARGTDTAEAGIELDPAPPRASLATAGDGAGAVGSTASDGPTALEVMAEMKAEKVAPRAPNSSSTRANPTGADVISQIKAEKSAAGAPGPPATTVARTGADVMAEAKAATSRAPAAPGIPRSVRLKQLEATDEAVEHLLSEVEPPQLPVLVRPERARTDVWSEVEVVDTPGLGLRGLDFDGLPASTIRNRLAAGETVEIARTATATGEALESLSTKKDVWAWFQRYRRDNPRVFTGDDAFGIYKAILAELGIKSSRSLRHARGYRDSLRDSDKLHAYWERVGLAVNKGTADAPDWRYVVDDTKREYTRDEVDFGHILDVVVYDKLVFLVECDLLEALHSGRLAIPSKRIDEAFHILRETFMDFPMNYVPELRGPNRVNGSSVGVGYADAITPTEALGRMEAGKSVGHLPSVAPDPSVVLRDLLDLLADRIPESPRIADWRGRYHEFSPTGAGPPTRLPELSPDSAVPPPDPVRHGDPVRAPEPPVENTPRPRPRPDGRIPER